MTPPVLQDAPLRPPRTLPRYTWEDYAKWEGNWELVRGVPFMSPSPSESHVLLALEILHQFRMALRGRSPLKIAAELDWIAGPNTTIRPDGMIYAGTLPRGWLEHAPLLVLEVLSPSTAERDRTDKFDICQEAGVSYFLLADPEARTVEAHVLENGAYRPLVAVDNRLTFPLAGIEVGLDLAEVWAALPV